MPKEIFLPNLIGIKLYDVVIKNSDNIAVMLFLSIGNLKEFENLTLILVHFQ